MTIYKLIIIAIIASALTACSAATETAKPNANAGTENKKTEPAKPVANAANEPEKPKTETTSDSPSATIGQYFSALQKNDAETVKKYTTKAALEEFEKAAKAQNKNLVEMILDGEDLSKKPAPETRNEKIDGNSATVEVKDDETGKWEKVPLVKEDGIWKIAFEKLKE